MEEKVLIWQTFKEQQKRIGDGEKRKLMSGKERGKEEELQKLMKGTKSQVQGERAELNYDKLTQSIQEVRKVKPYSYQ